MAGESRSDDRRRKRRADRLVAATLLALAALGACVSSLPGADLKGQGDAGARTTDAADTTTGVGGAPEDAATTISMDAGSSPRGCRASDQPPGAPLITDFSTDALGNLVVPIGGTFTYPAAGGPIATASGGAWHVTATTRGMTMAQYWGVGIYFNGNPTGTDCIDATAYSGVQFDVWGSIAGPGCTAQYATDDSAHADNAVDPKGMGDATSYSPQAALMVSPTPATLMIPFLGSASPLGGSPPTPVDKSKLTGVHWQFTTAAGLVNGCAVDIFIDNVRFF